MAPSVLLAALLAISAAPPWAQGPAPPVQVLAPDDQKIFKLQEAEPALRERALAERQSLQVYGFRFRPDGTIESHQTKKPITVLELKQYLESIRLGSQHGALERMHHILASRTQSGALSADELAELRKIAENQKANLPQSLVKAVSAPAPDVAALKQETGSLYAQSAAYFDGQASLETRLKNSQAVAPGWGERPRPLPSYVDPAEKALGELLQKRLESLLRLNPVGRELLASYTGKDGTVKLPPLLVLPGEARYGAFYNSASDAIVINQLHVSESIVAAAPPKEQAALREKFKDPQKLAEYLNGQPSALDGFLKEHDVVFVHELQHGVQDRRQRLGVEMERGNAPGMIPIDHEHECFLIQSRYLHHKLLADPQSALKSPWLPKYEELIEDMEAFENGITRQYLEGWPESAGSLKEIERVNETRKQLARGKIADSWYSNFDQLLKLAGLELGSGAIEEERRAHQARMDEFRLNELPRMRYDGFMALAKARATTELDRALLSAIRAEGAAAPLAPADRSAAKSYADLLQAEALKKVKAGAGSAVSRGSLMSVIARRGAVDQATSELVFKSYIEAAEESWSMSERATDPAAKKAYAENARAWTGGLGETEEDIPLALRERWRRLRAKAEEKKP